MIKKSMRLNGHDTSISLEKEFWEVVEKIANIENKTVKSIIENIDKERMYSSYSCLSSRIRVYVLNYLLENLKSLQPTNHTKL